jgi:hypothetical protein
MLLSSNKIVKRLRSDIRVISFSELARTKPVLN